MNPKLNYKHLFEQLPESDLWQLLQGVIASEVELDDDVIERLDDRMQGYLFLQESVVNRKARIAFARSSGHMLYLRDAAGSRNVCMDDEQFTELVNQGDSVTLACFARCEQMKPHHLAYIEYKLLSQPHANDQLATSYDATITLKKALESQGNSRELAVFRLAKLSVGNIADNSPESLWLTYLSLKTLDGKALHDRLAAAGLSTGRPMGTSGAAAESIH